MSLPSAFHFLRFRSSPSTFRTTRVGAPRSRGSRHVSALTALQTRTASYRSRPHGARSDGVDDRLEVVPFMALRKPTRTPL